MRLFVALYPPAATAKEIEMIAYGIRGFKWTPPEQYHITMQFIGDVDPMALDPIAYQLETIKSEPFYVRLKGVDFFPQNKDPEKLWVGVEESEDLLDLQKQIAYVLAPLGIVPDKKKFTPHVTIGKVDEKRFLPDVVNFIQSHSLFKSDRFKVQNFYLCSSHLKPTGAEHTIEETFPLL